MADLFRKLVHADLDALGFRQEWRDLMRGVTGGMIFGIPLLYTMEIWFVGQVFSTGILTAILLAVLNLNILFSFFAGLREQHLKTRFSFAVIDGVSSLGIGLLISAGVLYLLKRIDPAEDLNAALGKVLLEACVVSIGVTFTNLKFKGERTDASSRTILQGKVHPVSAARRQLKKDINDLMAAAVGAFIFSFNIAPTEEVILIAAGLNDLDLLLLLIFELLICYVILYASGIKQHQVFKHGSFFQGPLNELLLTSSVAFIVCFLLLISIGYNGLGPTSADLAPSIIVLGLPAVIGGAAGRLVI